MDRIMEMSEPKKVDENKIYANFDDTKNCTFQPRIRKLKSESENEAKQDTDFLGRMDATERARRHKLQRTREEKDYAAKLEKKVCQYYVITYLLTSGIDLSRM